ncbi:MAG: SMP-30/gluconolactonase/LRE family protein [Chloroflexota bacterium]
MTRTHVLFEGLLIGESPRWHDGRLWLCHWGTGEITTIDPDGTHDVAARVPVALPFSIDWLPDGRLLAVAGPERTILRDDGGLTGAGDGDLDSWATHADLSDLTHASLNELVVDGLGRAWVNGIGFDMMAGEAPGPGFVARVDPDGTAVRVAEGLAFPNGMAITPDGATLIVAESHGRRLTAFPILADGSLGPARTWADLGEGTPDGICLDAEGAVWYADVPNRRCVRVAEGGAVLDRVELDRGGFACMLGGPDGRTLHILAADWGGVAGMSGGPTGQVLTVEVAVPHAGMP